MGLFLSWLLFSFVVGFIGSGRKIGFWGAFFLSFILSPIIGLIIALVSKNKADEEYKKKVLMTQRIQSDALQESLDKLSALEKKKTESIAVELEKLIKLKDDNYISEEEFMNLKNKIINS